MAKKPAQNRHNSSKHSEVEDAGAQIGASPLMSEICKDEGRVIHSTLSED